MHSPTATSWCGASAGQPRTEGSFLGIPATGRRVRGQGTVILRIAEGKIAEEWEMSDLLGLLQQLGAVPAFSSDESEPM